MALVMPYITYSVIFFVYLLLANTLGIPPNALQARAGSTDLSASPPPSSPHPYIHKRGATLLDHCPPGTTFISSYCSQTTESLRDYSLHCRGNNRLLRDEIHSGTCGPNELCIETRHAQRDYVTSAYCLGQDHFLKTALIPSAPSHTNPTTSLILAFDVPPGKVYALNALVTTPDRQRRLNTTSLGIQAQGLDTAFRPPGYRELQGGSTRCEGCAVVAMYPVPGATKRVDVDVVMQGAGVESGGWLILTGMDI